MSSPLSSDGPLHVCGVWLGFALPPLVSEGVGLVCVSVGKADLHLPSFSLPYRLFLHVKRGQVSLVRFGPLWWH